MRPKRTMALASRSKRLACLIFAGQDLKVWHCSSQGAKSPEAAAAQFKIWVQKYKPDIVVFEDLQSAKRKALRQKLILKTLYTVARNRRVKHLKIRREKAHRNRYDEAAILAKRFPTLKHLVPKKPPIWQAEARTLVFFEALTLAIPVIDERI